MGAQLHELSHEECLRLLSRGGVGRIGFTSPSGQQIVPVNYELIDDAIVCRTTPYSELGRVAGSTEAAFEIDELDTQRRTGWSVVARGRLYVVVRQAEVAAIKMARDPDPWASGVRQLYLKLVWRELTGRWIGATGVSASTPSTSSPSSATGQVSVAQRPLGRPST